MRRIPPGRKTGREPFLHFGTPTSFTLNDFWGWAASDLVSNATRGLLAEYVVARALGLTLDGVRDEWAAFDLTLPDGTRIEVKSAAYLQSWHQEKPSRISFSIRPSRTRDTEPRRQAQVYVFALLAHQDKLTINPLDLNQWEFYVLSTARLDANWPSQKSIGIGLLVKLRAGPYAFDALRDVVKRVLADSQI